MGQSGIAKIKISSDVISQEVFFDETILLHVKTLTYFGLDPLGTRLWKLISEGVEPDQLVETLSDEFELPREDAWRKCQGILAALQKTGLVTIAP